MNHSCNPNVMVQYRGGMGTGRPLVLEAVAIRGIRKGEELRISYVDCGMREIERRKELEVYGFRCDCERCKEERGEVDRVGGDDEDDGGGLFGDHSDGDGDGNDGGGIFGDDSGDDEVEQNNLPTPPPVDAMTPCIVMPNGIHAETAGFAVSVLEDYQEGEFVVLVDKVKEHMGKKEYMGVRIEGGELYKQLKEHLQRNKGFKPPTLLPLFLSTSTLLALANAESTRFIDAINVLDFAFILGLPRGPVTKLMKYIEPMAFSASSSPSETLLIAGIGGRYKVKNWTLSEPMILSEGLTGPITHPLQDGSIETFCELVKSDTSHRLPGYAKGWKALPKLHDMSFLVIRHGHRVVPVEVGAMNASSGLAEKTVTIKEFVNRWLVESSEKGLWDYASCLAGEGVCYLAQHDILSQIPSLTTLVPPCPEVLESMKTKPLKVAAWLGTGGTKTPLHFDSYENVFVQIVGVKYVRIYPKSTTPRERLYLKGGEGVGKQGNMSEVEVENVDEENHPGFKDLEYKEVLLFPGDSMYIAPGDWHYVRSLTTSFSVSYWF